jgi:hypothetical protein
LTGSSPACCETKQRLKFINSNRFQGILPPDIPVGVFLHAECPVLPSSGALRFESRNLLKKTMPTETLALLAARLVLRSVDGSFGKNKTSQPMKNISKFKTPSLAAIAMIASLAASVHAQTISWNFDGWGDISGSSELAGVALVPYWNSTFLIDGNSGATENNLLDSTGTATTMSVGSFVDNSRYGYQIQSAGPGVDADGNYSRSVLNGYLNNGGGASVSMTLNSIPYSVYDIIVYLSSDTAGRTGTVNIGSATYDFSTMGPAEIGGTPATAGSGNATFTQTTDTSGANPSADYAIFSGLAGSSQTISSTIASYGGIAGFQVVAVPEPRTMALAGMGGLAVLLMRRRFQKN